MRNFKAFSLIELMVVIAIVGILAAVAAPAYKRYIISSKLGSVLPTMDSLVEEMIVYANANGVFPNAYQLGLSANLNTATVVDNPSAINPLFSYAFIQDNGSSGGVNCGATGLIGVVINSPSIGLPSTTYISILCRLYNINGAIQKLCYFYGTFSNDNGQTYHTYGSSLIPGMVSYFSNSQYGSNATGAECTALGAAATCM